MDPNYLSSVIKQFEYYKMLAEKTIEQVNEPDLFWQYNTESNSIAIIIQHLSGNMLSRWTDFLLSDGEKEGRNRDNEFNHTIQDKEQLMASWNAGWDCLLTTLSKLTDEDLSKIIYIRNQGHTVTEAINRQLAHYPYHIGQIVFMGKMLRNEQWESLSIPKGNSGQYNTQKFATEKSRIHFTEEYLQQAPSSNYQIENTTIDDLELIYWFFEEAIHYINKNKYVGWTTYDKNFIQWEIENQLQYKIIQDDTIICIFSVCYADEQIWREREKGDAIYLHRIVVNPAFKGQKQVEKVINWAQKNAQEKQLGYIRMDTWAANTNIIDYYKKFGFNHMGDYTTSNSSELPIQHHNLQVALLELELKK
ncbi:GNAT family N-acetyltransferase [Aquirufa beregesia]|uniref:GNAT family N-acetyltransferase n=1 Tax=Aquirufa beregesia TaxID=2516556 RepID=UPI00293BC008|nr:GNAT family N-acetyltransferase [Aquirufa beregesia]